jgi:DNA-binding transcriptional regulator YiaG
MSAKPKTPKAPKLFIKNGSEACVLRKKLALNQSAFWKRIQVTQSGGSRYESGRNLPRPVQLLLHLTYAPEEQALAMLNYLRIGQAT